ncbi:MAG: twin-arginine translocase TatA/TatE family subunit [Eubacteriales bacterium]|nr:twin-arginine translocase TatA/TatE family subunit [Lachnospiraceae bacterium]MDO4417575.1 twin-arginine translocase TatA/TatE family subunit [Eubacteriales bacterium]
MGLGPGEIALILVIAYVIVGPEDMGKLARTLAKALREIRKLSADLQKEAGDSLALPASVKEKEIPAAELESVLREIREAEERISKV